jgi:MFS family permease
VTRTEPDLAARGSRPRPVYADRNVLRWLAGLWLSLLGDEIFFIALAWTATQVAPPALTGLIVAAGAVPRAVLMLFGGALADRVGPKKLALASDAARTVVMLGFAVLLVSERPSVVTLVVLSVVFGVIDALFIPAVGALPASLADAADMARLQAMRQVVTRASTIVGAPVAGWLIARHGLSAVYVVNAVLFAGSVLLLLLTKLRAVSPVGSTAAASLPDGTAGDGTAGREKRPGLLTDVMAGLRYVRGHRLLLPLLTLTAVAEFGFTGAFNVGLPLLADGNSWGAQGMGVILGAFGIGAGGAALGLTVAGNVSRPGLLICGSLPASGVALAVIGLAPGVWTAAGAAAVLGVGAGVMSALLGALTVTASEADQLGRVVALSSLASLGGIPLAFTAAGVLADLTNPTVPFVAGGSLCAVAGLVAFSVTSLREAALGREVG